MMPRDPLMPLGAVVIGRTVIVPDAERPVAAVIDEGSTVRWVIWPDAPLPDRAIGEVQLLPTSTGAWVVYQAEETEGLDYLVRRTAVFVTPNGVTAACDLGQGRPVGVDDYGLWVGDPRDASAWMESPDSEESATEVVFDEDALNIEPSPPLPTPATELVRISVSGERTVIWVDHLVHRASVVQDNLTLQYFPTGPRQVPLGDDRGWDVVYEPEQVIIDVADGLPEKIDTQQLSSKPAPGDEEETWEQEYERQQAAAAQWQDRLELDGVEGAAWPLRNLSEEARAGAIAKLREQFESLAEPNTVWTSDHPLPRLEPSDYRNVGVSEEGTWPATEIVVSFEHSTVPNLRLRRRYRVFNDAGHPREWAYTTVHLEEDLYTGKVPPRSAAINGVLDI